MNSIVIIFMDTRCAKGQRVTLRDVDTSGSFFRGAVDYAAEMLTKFTPYRVTVEWR
jgi:hypothetical protein